MGEPQSRDKTVTLVFLDRLHLKLDFNDERVKYLGQFGDYLGLYDVEDAFTVLNLETWARTRGIPYTITVRGVGFISTLLRLMVFCNKILVVQGAGVLPRKRPKDYGD